MPIWAWMFLALCIAYGALVLWRAWAKGFVKYGPIRFTRKDDTFTFWFLVGTFCICEFFLVGMLVLVVVALINGPIVDQRKCPTAHGWWKALNCPSVDENGAYVPRAVE
jgi:hypothetical protein